jgi:hypothetical protein
MGRSEEPVRAEGPPATGGERGGGVSPLEADSAPDAFSERPELYVAAALAGGLILKRLRRG